MSATRVIHELSKVYDNITPRELQIAVFAYESGKVDCASELLDMAKETRRLSQ